MFLGAFSFTTNPKLRGEKFFGKGVSVFFFPRGGGFSFGGGRFETSNLCLKKGGVFSQWGKRAFAAFGLFVGLGKKKQFFCGWLFPKKKFFKV